MRRSSITLLILLSLPPAVAGEIAIAAVSEEQATLSQSVASGASDGNDFLFVWSDVTHGSYDCRAARVTRDGVVLDRGGIPIPANSRNSVVWTGSSYLILWDQKERFEIRGMRIGRDGTILDGPRTIRPEASISSVAGNGTHVVIQYRTGPTADGARDQRVLFLDSEAEIAADVLLAHGNIAEVSSLAWNGTHFVAAWVDSPDTTHPNYTVEATRFDIHGRIGAAPRQLLSDPSSELAISLDLASDGDGFLLVTRHSDDREYAQRMSSDLGTIGAPYVLPWLSYGDELYYKTNYSSSIFWNGSSYLHFAFYLQTISAVQLDREGRTIGTETVEDGGGDGKFFPVAAANSRDFFVGWTEFPSTPYSDAGSDAFGALVSGSTLRSRARTLLSIAPAVQKRPLIASGGTGLLTMWEEGSGIYARRLGPDGSSFDASPLRLAGSGTPKALLFNGSDYLAFWSTPSNDLQIARLPRDGMLRVDGGGTLPATEILGAANDGVVTLLLVKRDSKLQAVRILADGSPGGTIQIASDGFGKADIAAGNGEFLVVWEATVLTDAGYYYPTLDKQIHGVRLSSSLVLLDTAAFNISLDRSYEEEPAAAWNGREWLVVWRSCGSDSIYGTSSCELRGRRIPRSAVPQSGDNGTLIAKSGRLPSMTWDGNRYALAWWDSYSSTKVHAGFFLDLGLPLTGQLEIQFYPFDQLPLRLAPIQPGLVATAYARTSADGTYREVTRAFVNLVTLPVPSPRRHAAK